MILDFSYLSLGVTVQVVYLYVLYKTYKVARSP